MHKKKLAGLVLLGLLLSLLISACSDSTTTTVSTPTENAPSTSQAMPTTPAEGMLGAPTTTANPNFTPVGLPTTAASQATAPAVLDANLKGELVIWETLSAKLSPVVREQAQTFSKAYPGAKTIVVHYDPSEISYALEDAAKAKKLPDLVLASADYALDFSQVQAIQPADKVLDKTFLESLAPGAAAGSRLNGTQWGVAYTYSGSPVMLYNKRLVPNPPQTWDELATVVKPLYDPQSRQVGLALDVNEPYFVTALVGAFDGKLLDNQNKPTLDTPAMINSLEFIQQLEKDKVVRNESRARDNQIEYAFREGRLGIYITGDWDIANYAISSYGGAGSSTDADSKLEMAVAPLPKVDKTGKNPVPYSNSKTFFVGAQVTGEKLKLVKTYLSWVSQPEQQASMLDKLKLLPASQAFLTSEAVSKHPFWGALLVQLQQSQPLPATPQMRSVQEALRLPLQNLVAGTVPPVQTARQMQQRAVENISKLAAIK